LHVYLTAFCDGQTHADFIILKGTERLCGKCSPAVTPSPRVLCQSARAEQRSGLSVPSGLGLKLQCCYDALAGVERRSSI
jgi:hypothetical protein